MVSSPLAKSRAALIADVENRMQALAYVWKSLQEVHRGATGVLFREALAHAGLPGGNYAKSPRPLSISLTTESQP